VKEGGHVKCREDAFHSSRRAQCSPNPSWEAAVIPGIRLPSASSGETEARTLTFTSLQAFIPLLTYSGPCGILGSTH